jgi:cytosine/adenosine deaminase-related metal-dependent hydrolase
MLRAQRDDESLREFGYAVSIDRGPITTEAYLRIRAWREQWQAYGCPQLPLVLIDGATLTGWDALRRLGKQVGYSGAEVDPVLADPRRYPAVRGRPSPAWVSQIGGRWRTIYRLGSPA